MPNSTLSNDERGLVITDWKPQNIRGGNVSFGEFTINHAELRAELVFFDRFDIPAQNVIGRPYPVYDFLNREGIAQSTRVSMSGSGSDIIRLHSLLAYKALDHREPNKWAMGRSVQAFGYQASDLSDKQSIQLKILNALPVFAPDVELSEILEFKIRRKPELLALRSHLDGVAQRVRSNGVEGLEDSAELLNFIKSLDDHMKIMGESNREKILRNFKASFSADLLIPPIIEAAATFGLSQVSALSTGAMITVKTIQGFRQRDRTSPYEYLTSANHDFG